MIIKDKKLIYIHINKCAGSSIESFFFGQAIEDHKVIMDFEDSLGSKELNDYFKFSFVRNPWDKTVSFYNFHKKFNVLDTSSGLKNFLLAHPSSWMPKNGSPLKKTAFTWLGSNYSHLMRSSNQIDWLTDSNGEVRMDFIGRFENLQEDFNIVCDKIGIPRKQLPHKNKSNHKHYTEYYDEETKQIVAEKYAKDIEYFGYKFGE